jgi:hypothetical protein
VAHLYETHAMPICANSFHDAVDAVARQPINGIDAAPGQRFYQEFGGIAHGDFSVPFD